MKFPDSSLLKKSLLVTSETVGAVVTDTSTSDVESTPAAVVDAVGANVPPASTTSVEDNDVEDPEVEGTNVLIITAGVKELPSEATAIVGAIVSPEESVAEAGDDDELLLLLAPSEPASNDDDVVEAIVGNGDDSADVPTLVVLPASDGLSVVPSPTSDIVGAIVSPEESVAEAGDDDALLLTLSEPASVVEVIVGNGDDPAPAGVDVPTLVVLPASDGLSVVPSPTSDSVPAKDGAFVLLVLLPPPVIVGAAVAVLPSIVGTVPDTDGVFVAVFSEPVFHVGTWRRKSMWE